MRVIVQDDDGKERFSYSTNKDENCLCPGKQEIPETVASLEEATRFLSGPPEPLRAETSA